MPPKPNAASKAGYLDTLSQQNNAHQDSLFNENNKGLDWITGPTGDPTRGPLYKSFLTQARTNIGNAYDNAVINSRQNAGARGFGYASPMEQTGEMGLRGSEASDLGRAPSEALQKTMPYDIEAMNMRADEGKVFGAESMQQEEMSNSDFMANWQQQQKNKHSLYSSLAKLAATGLAIGAAPFSGGASLAALPAISKIG